MNSSQVLNIKPLTHTKVQRKQWAVSTFRGSKRTIQSSTGELTVPGLQLLPSEPFTPGRPYQNRSRSRWLRPYVTSYTRIFQPLFSPCLLVINLLLYLQGNSSFWRSSLPAHGSFPDGSCFLVHAPAFEHSGFCPTVMEQGKVSIASVSVWLMERQGMWEGTVTLRCQPHTVLSLSS